MAWTLSDGHAGNVRQAQALAAALGLRARDWVLAARAPWRWVAPRRLPGVAHAFGDAFALAAAAEPPPLAIGCGRQAALATRLLRARGARAVQILDPRIATRHWELVIVPDHDDRRGANVINLLGSLNPVDDLWLAAARAAFPALGQLPRPLTTVLVGGPSRHAAFDDSTFDALATRLLALQRRDGGSVLVTTSRRTPAAVAARLRSRFAGVPGQVWSGADEGPNPYPGLLGWADRIVCTADSVNMLSEACATNVPVFVCGAAQLAGRPRRFVDALLARDRVRGFGEPLDAFAVTPLRETARVAAEVRARLQG
jgi:mitochondrial fission protein ELM1